MSTRPRRHRRVASTALAFLTFGLLVLAIAGPVPGAMAAGGGTGSGGGGGGGGGGHHGDPFRGDGMWIWYVSKSSGGSLSRIAHKAKAHGMRTLYIKSADGVDPWSQFTHRLVSYFHRRGLRVCGWQFVYGRHPSAEARRGASAAHKGADCLVIDAESDYEGRYAAADTYVDKLRHRVGRRFPTALSSFPYVDYHPGLPYSVFLGPGGARFNLPQTYWHAIGVGVGEALRHTFLYNRVYDRPIYPLGQTYRDEGGRPPVKQIQRFRRLALSFGLRGVSWWDWQETTSSQWRALGEAINEGVKGVHPRRDAYPQLSRGSRGDLVVWAQEHLNGAGGHVKVNGVFARKTYRAVKRFQRSVNLPAVGQVGPRTWRKLLRVKPDMVDWSSAKRPPGKRAGPAPEPRSASLPAVRDEIPPPPGR